MDCNHSYGVRQKPNRPIYINHINGTETVAVAVAVQDRFKSQLSKRLVTLFLKT